MPKKSRKANRTSGKDSGSDDDSAFNDNASLISQNSEASNFKEEGEDLSSSNNPNDESEEIFEEKIKEAIDLASQKSANGRVMSLEALSAAFSKRFLPDFLQTRFFTISDIIDRALKKGKTAEQTAAANLAVSLTLQLGECDSAAEEVYNCLKPALLFGLNDPSGDAKARAVMATTLGTLCFLAGGEMTEVVDIMEVLEKIFINKVNRDCLINGALSAWSLLLTIVPPVKAHSMLDSYMSILGDYLDSSDVEVRISAGEAIVILYENSALHDEDDAFDIVSIHCPKLKELATDSNKYRSKKDRKEQRSSFRDILRTVEEGDTFYEKISINSKETFYLESWMSKKQYDFLCKVLLSGVNLHMTENELVRDIFGLGSPLPVVSVHQSTKPSKLEKQFVNSQAFKYRTKTRGKERDKRNAIV